MEYMCYVLIYLCAQPPSVSRVGFVEDAFCTFALDLPQPPSGGCGLYPYVVLMFSFGPSPRVFSGGICGKFVLVGMFMQVEEIGGTSEYIPSFE